MAKAKPDFNRDQLNELLYQALETEMGGIQVYETALQCVVNDDLREEWEKYLEETRRHHAILVEVFGHLGLDPDTQTPGRQVVHHIGQSLVKAMQMALSEGVSPASELVAAECVCLAETKDHMNWELLGKVVEHARDKEGGVLKEAYDAVEQEEDHHLYHTAGWARELWIQSLGMPAVLPPPEEVKNVETAIGASRAEQARDTMIN